MAERVVDIPEVVEVEHQHGNRPAVPSGPFELGGQPLLELDAVGEPRQPVVSGAETG
jgi:hypothetical protein